MVRRAPRYLSFLGTGAVAGLLLTALVVLLRGDAVESPRKLFAYLGVLLVGLGALAGAAVAVWLDGRRS